MSRQSSRMYGVKVKEKINYYEFGDAGTGKQITLSYSNKVWTVKAGGKLQPHIPVSWWRNGVEYIWGDTILTFNDGADVTFHIMEQDRSEVPYINLMYDIFGNMAMNAEYGTKEVYYRILPGSKQYSCKVYKYVNGLIESTKEFTSEDIIKYKRSYSEMKPGTLYPVYNMLFDWHGMDPSSGYPQMSFQAISNSNYIKYNGTTIEKGSTIRTWQAIGFSGFEVTDDTNKHEAVKMTDEDAADVKLVKRNGGLTICDETKNNKTIYSDLMHDHNEAYYNGYWHNAMYLVYDNPGVDGCWRKRLNSVALTYADPFWFLVTATAGVQYNGYTYEKQKLLKSWRPTESVNISLREEISRKRATPNKTAEKFVYDIEEQGGVDSVTIKWQQVVTVIDQEGHSHKEYIDIETRTFTSSESVVNFRNLQFRVFGSKWTIFSKCGYIKFDGKTYPKGRSILSFSIAEAIHIEIGDDTNIYEIKELRLYSIKTPNSDVTINYRIITSEMTNALKLIKMSGDKEEPWVTVNNFDAMYEPFKCDDISVRFDREDKIWELYSNNDSLFYNGTNYKKGSTIKTWHFGDIFSISGITVVHPSTEALQASVQIIKDGKIVKNNDIEEDIGWYDPDDLDFHLSYSYSKGTWLFKAIHNCWIEGVNYTTGSILRTFKTKNVVSPFTMMFRHYEEEAPDIPVNVLYQVSVSIEPVSGVTTVDINCPGHGSNSYSDKDISNEADKALTFTTVDAKSMYGYIWKKYSPTPPTPDYYDTMFLVYRRNTYSGYSGGVLLFDSTSKGSKMWGIASYLNKSTEYFRDLDSTSLAIHLQTPPYVYSSVSIIYSNNGEEGITYIDGLNNWDEFFWESMYAVYSINYVQGFKKYLVNHDHLTLMGTFNTPLSGASSKQIVGKIGSYLIVWHNSPYDANSFCIINFEANTIVYDCIFDLSASGLNDFLEEDYPLVKGAAGTDTPGPHENGYERHLILGENSDGTYYDSDSTGVYYLLDDRLVMYVGFTYQYVEWYSETSHGHTHWYRRYSPVIGKDLISITYTQSGFSFSYVGMENIMAKAIHPGEFDGGYYVYNYSKNFSYKWNDDYYCIIRKFDSVDYASGNLIAAYICKLNKESNVFEIVKTITESTSITVPMYLFPSGEGSRVTVNLIGTENLYFNALDNELTIFGSRGSGRAHSYPIKLMRDSPLQDKPGIVFRIAPNSNDNGYGYYLFIDNPLFNFGIGNFLLRY